MCFENFHTEKKKTNPGQKENIKTHIEYRKHPYSGMEDVVTKKQWLLTCIELMLQQHKLVTEKEEEKEEGKEGRKRKR